MSYDDNDQQNYPQGIDGRMVGIKTDLAILESMRHPDFEISVNSAWIELYKKYPILGSPALSYGYIPDQVMADKIVRQYCHALDLEYGSGKRLHTLSELGELENVKVTVKQLVYLSIGGFGRAMANTTVINQKHEVKQTQAPARSALARLPVVGRMFR